MVDDDLAHRLSFEEAVEARTRSVERKDSRTRAAARREAVATLTPAAERRLQKLVPLEFTIQFDDPFADRRTAAGSLRGFHTGNYAVDKRDYPLANPIWCS